MDKYLVAAGCATALAMLFAVSFVIIALLPSEQCGLDADGTDAAAGLADESLVSESRCGLGEQRALLPGGQIWSAREIEALYSTVDLDLNAVISRDEFRNFLNTISMLDENSDLVISRMEFDSGLRSMGVVAEGLDEKLLVIFEALDTDVNNELSASEAKTLTACIPDHVYLDTEQAAPFDYSAVYEICVGCPAGKYRNASSGALCEPCEVGFYATGAGTTTAVECVACGSGMTTASRGAESCVCERGWSPRYTHTLESPPPAGMHMCTH